MDVIRRESRRRLREQIASEMNVMNSHADSGTGFQPVWADIEPLFDEAMESLDKTDRSALLLRYFESKSLREVGTALGTIEDAAQKRVSRAVERLREFFSKRGVAVGASGLVVLLSANAVQAAPVGLAAAISTAATLAGTTIATTATATAAKAIAMTTIQKKIIGTTLAVAVGTGIYEARQASALRSQVQTRQQQHASWDEQNQRLQSERYVAMSKLVALQKENEELRGNIQVLAKLRGEDARMRSSGPEQAQQKPDAGDMNDPFTRSVLAMMARALELNQHLEQMPDQKIPELDLLSENDWLSAA